MTRREWFAQFGLKPSDARQAFVCVAFLMDHYKAIETANAAFGGGYPDVQPVINGLRHIIDDAPDSSRSVAGHTGGDVR